MSVETRFSLFYQMWKDVCDSEYAGMDDKSKYFKNHTSRWKIILLAGSKLSLWELRPVAIKI